MFVNYSTHILTLKDRNSSEYYNIFVEYYGNIILLLNQKLGFSDDTRQKIIESINDISKDNKIFIPDENGISDIQTKNRSLNSDNSDASFIQLSKDNLGLSLSIVKSFSSGNNDELIKNIQTLTKNNIQLYMKVTGKSDYQNIHDKFIVPLVAKIQTWSVDSSSDASDEQYSELPEPEDETEQKNGGKRKTKRRRTRRTRKNKKRKTKRHRR